MIDEGITIRQLRNFVVTAEALNFRRAAIKLNISQPPLTRSIQELEHAVGARLFERTSRNVRLMSSGQAFYPEAIKILESVRKAKERANFCRSTEAKLTVGFIEPVSYQVLPRLLPLFRSDFPHVAVEFLHLSSMAQFHALKNRQIDIGILRPPVDLSGLGRRALYDDALVLAVPSHYPDQESVADLAAFRDRPFVSYAKERGDSIYDATLRVCRRSGFTPAAMHEASSTTLLLSLVAADVGVALVSKQISNTPRPGVRFVKINPEPFCPVEIVWREQDWTKEMERLIEHAVTAANDTHAAPRIH